MGHSYQVKPILVDGLPQNGKKKKKVLNFRKAFAKFPDQKKLNVQIIIGHLIPKRVGGCELCLETSREGRAGAP